MSQKNLVKFAVLVVLLSMLLPGAHASDKEFGEMTVRVIDDSISSAQMALTQTQANGPTLAVLVYNYSDASPAVAIQAVHQADRILTQADIHLTWTDCPIHPTPEASAACYEEPTPGEVRVRILSRPLNHNFQDSVFGFAIAPIWASVYYESAVRLTRLSVDGEFHVTTILGCLIAHEIGHLLLGENRHSVSGIMTARWQISHIVQAMRGTLVFTPEQAQLMRCNSVARMQLLTARVLEAR